MSEPKFVNYEFQDGIATIAMNDGFKNLISPRMLSFPTPIVIACNGHAIAMGSFLLLSGDYRIGANGLFKIVANEVRIGITMAATPIVVCRQRLTPAHFVRAVMQSEEYHPVSAVEAGFLDRTVAPSDLLPEAVETANRLAALDRDVYYRSKLRARRQLIKALKRANRFDRFDIFIRGIQRMFK